MNKETKHIFLYLRSILSNVLCLKKIVLEQANGGNVIHEPQT